MPPKLITIISFLVICNSTYGQKKFKVVAKETGTWRDLYCLVDEQGNTLRQLDTSQYLMSFINDEYVYFAILSKKGRSGWTAIDANEKEIFTVYNTSIGEPSPDYLIEGKIRIVDGNNKIGFADSKGKIIISPRFDMATSFHNGKAIIGQSCKLIPWGDHSKENGCRHYSIECRQHGYINEKGVVLKIGNQSFEQIQKAIGWKPHEE